jgi:hypothetical protein
MSISKNEELRKERQLEEYEDHKKMRQALVAWFASQRIDPRDAVGVMAFLSGVLIGREAQSKADFDSFLEGSVEFLTKTANAAADPAMRLSGAAI